MEVSMTVVVLFLWFSSIAFPFIISGSNYRQEDDDETNVANARKDSHFLRG